jgi:hypothetical protein
MEPLYLTTRTRVYRPDETSTKVQEKACQREHEQLEADILTDRLRDSFAEELAQHGLEWRTDVCKGGPWWSLDRQGACVGAELECTDLAKYCAARNIMDPDLLRLADSGNLSLRSKASGHYSRTVDDSEDALRDSDGPAMNALGRRILEDWRAYLADLTGRMHRDLETDRDYLISWECVKESAESNGYGFDDNGNTVPLEDCEALDKEGRTIEGGNPAADGEVQK